MEKDKKIKELEAELRRLTEKLTELKSDQSPAPEASGPPPSEKEAIHEPALEPPLGAQQQGQQSGPPPWNPQGGPGQEHYPHQELPQQQELHHGGQNPEQYSQQFNPQGYFHGQSSFQDAQPQSQTHPGTPAWNPQAHAGQHQQHDANTGAQQQNQAYPGAPAWNPQAHAGQHQQHDANTGAQQQNQTHPGAPAWNPQAHAAQHQQHDANTGAQQQNQAYPGAPAWNPQAHAGQHQQHDANTGAQQQNQTHPGAPAWNPQAHAGQYQQHDANTGAQQQNQTHPGAPAWNPQAHAGQHQQHDANTGAQQQNQTYPGAPAWNPQAQAGQHLPQQEQQYPGSSPDGRHMNYSHDQQQHYQHAQPQQQERSTEAAYQGRQPAYGQFPNMQQPANAPRTSSKDWEYAISRVWLPRVFIVVLLLGVLWLFMAAVNAGYLSEPVRCLLGAVLAAAMYWFGDRQVRQEREALGQVVLGGANAVLVLTLFAAHMLYDLIPLGIAFVLYIMSIAFGVFIAVHHRSQTLVIIALLSGYLIPFLAKSPANPWMFILYTAVFSIAMMLVSVRFDFRAAYIVAITVLHVPLLILYAQGYYDNSKHLFLIAILLQHFVLYGITAAHRYRHKLDQMILLPISFFLLSLWMIGLYGSDEGYTFSILTALLSILYSVTAVVSLKHKQMSQLFASIATYGWVVFIVDSVGRDYKASVLLILGMLSFILGIKLRSLLQQIVGLTLYLFSALLIFFNFMPEFFSPETLAWFLLVASMPIPYFVARKQQEPAWVLSLWNVFNWVEAALGLIFLTQIAYVLTKAFSNDIMHLSMSGVWILYSAALIVFGLNTNRSRVRLAGVIFLFVILLKVIIIDLPWVSIAVRAVLFIALGLAGIATSRLLYKKKQEGDQPMSPDA